MSHPDWSEDLELGHKKIDHHHEEVFQLDRLLESAIKENNRSALGEIIEFLEHYTVDHFEEEESLMRDHQFEGYEEHHKHHSYFQVKVSDLRNRYEKTKHTTHLVYEIRRFIDNLINHICTIDVKMAPLVHDRHVSKRQES